MKILNLVQPNSSDINYKISSFPDGQQDVTIIDYPRVPTSLTEPITIRSRFNSFRDLEIIICATKALRNLGIEEITLYVPYILGARSDRQFVNGGTSYLRDVIAPILNSLNFKQVLCFDVHSDVAAACINRLKVLDNTSLVTAFISREAEKQNCTPAEFLNTCIFVSPDGGSLKKIYKVASSLKFDGEILTCSKYRGTDGKLSKTHVPYRIDHFSKNLVIIDDICDGGRTFLNIADEIKRTQPERTGKTYLIISHGIFSAGLDDLRKSLDGIYCSNSYSDITDPLVTQLGIF